MRSGQLLLWAAMSCAALAQPPPRGFDGPRAMGDHRPPMGRPPGPQGRWWSDPVLIQRLGLSNDQQRKMDAVFQQSRLKLIELSAALEKEQATLEPLLEAENPDEATVVAQIDRIAQARGELEKVNARMLLSFRRVLTQEQWKKLQSEGPPRRPPGPRP